jgi:uncharacterized protein
MVRIVRTAEEHVVVDPTGKLAGRGAYLCRRPGCWQEGLRKGVLARALKTTLSAADRQELEAYAAALPGEPVGTVGQNLAEGSRR